MISAELSRDIAGFRAVLLDDELTSIIDPVGIHHEFTDGGHGRKADFANVVNNPELFGVWADISARFIAETYHDRLPDTLVSVARGTNELSRSVAVKLGDSVRGVMTRRVNERFQLTQRAHELALKGMLGSFAVVLEDVGTTGKSTELVVEVMRQYGTRRIEVINGLQRSPALPYLDRAGIQHRALITAELPTFTPEQCASDPNGYCNLGYELIKRSNSNVTVTG